MSKIIGVWAVEQGRKNRYYADDERFVQALIEGTHLYANAIQYFGRYVYVDFSEIIGKQLPDRFAGVDNPPNPWNPGRHRIDQMDPESKRQYKANTDRLKGSLMRFINDYKVYSAKGGAKPVWPFES